VAQDVKTILALLSVQSAFPLLSKSKLVQVPPEGYMACKKFDAYPQFVSLQCQQIFSSVELGAIHQLSGPSVVLGFAPDSF